MITDVIIPVLNEENSIGLVIQKLPKNLIRNVIVCDNGSTDSSIQVARQSGAIVVYEPERGYGAACLKGLDFIENLEEKPDCILFIDGDYSDYPEESTGLLEAIQIDGYDLVIGSRVLGNAGKGSLTPVQKFGNWLSTKLIHFLYQYSFTDLGPFRSIRYKSLLKLDMKDRNYGWTVEMQVKAAKFKLHTKELAVSYRKRVGKSKVSGTLKGSIMAGYKILYTIFKLL
ncbi:MAG: glycosyltransferase family 2 protein [Saprospiraceae bacterium]|nr:glycosyltransferase family 2 protein [Saprospiraceae bacterium]